MNITDKRVWITALVLLLLGWYFWPTLMGLFPKPTPTVAGGSADFNTDPPKDPAGIYTVNNISHFEDMLDGTVDATLNVTAIRGNAPGNIYAKFDASIWASFFSNFKKTKSGTVKVSTYQNNKPRMYAGTLLYPVTMETGKKFPSQTKVNDVTSTKMVDGFEIWVNIPDWIRPVKGSEQQVKNHNLIEKAIDLNSAKPK